MINANENYNKYVADDLKIHKGLYHPAKAYILEQIKPRNISPQKLHPNPEDEFSMDNVGPNWEIISNYEKSILQHIKRGEDLFDEPLIAIKLDTGGYMLLNGHHRWMAALNLKLKTVPIKIVNITCEDDINQIINKSNRNKCVTIDFDEVLFSDDMQHDNDINFPYNLIYKKNIRANSSLMIREFQRLGYDVWVYTGTYLSEQYINGLFKINHCKADGIVNGINGKRNSANLKDIFRQRYNYIVHVGNEMLSCVDTHTKEYEIIDINSSKEEWAADIVSGIKRFNTDSIEG